MQHPCFFFQASGMVIFIPGGKAPGLTAGCRGPVAGHDLMVGLQEKYTELAQDYKPAEVNGIAGSLYTGSIKPGESA